MGFLEGLLKGMENLNAQIQAREEEAAKQRSERARQIYRNGGTCFSCAYYNNTGFCDNSNSKAYDRQNTRSICKNEYGVEVCPYYSGRY